MSRGAYNDAEIEAMRELLRLFGDEIERCGKAIIAYTAHAEKCENPNHRAACMHKVRELCIVLMDQVRYGAWTEAELAKVRMFENPVEALRGLKASQEAMAKLAAAKQGKVFEGEKKPDDSAAMDAMANAPSTSTKQ